MGQRRQGGAGWRFLFDGVPARGAAAGEVAHRVGTFRHRGDAVPCHGAEGLASVVFSHADVNDHAVAVRWETVVDSRRNTAQD